jgi:hypothetical protein
MVEHQRINLLERQVMDLKDILVSETTMNKENEFSSFNMNPTRAYSNNGTAASPQQDPVRGSQRH